MRTKEQASPGFRDLGLLSLIIFSMITSAPSAKAQGNDPTTVTVNAATNVHPISPYIYGMNWASPADLSALNAPINRSGGNINSTYNWKNNAGNHAADWYYESISGSSSVAGADEDSFVRDTKSANAEPILTIPTLGWVAKLGPNRESLASFSVAKYGAQQKNDPWWPDAGNGVKTDGTGITGNDPNDAFVPADVNYIKPDFTRLVNTFGQGANGGVKFYILDNEVDAWHATHRDAHPTGCSIDEMLNYTKAYGTALKAADPTAKVIGWDVWNWTGCITSGYDAQKGQGTDRASHSNMDVYPYLLQQLKAYEQTTGVRPIDYVSIHFYPQGYDGGSDSSTTTQLLRNRATRQLWDRNYTSESWMNTKIYAIPHLQDWINTYYPGLKTAITEYSWGGDNTMNGATTMADELGIFGKYGLDLATRWGIPASPSLEAYKMFRNYDGNKSTFGDTSVDAAVVNPDYLSSFAAIRGSDGALTIMVVNKTLSGTTPVTLNIANFSAASSAQVWQLSSSTINHLSNVAVASGSITLTVPAPSITMFVVPKVPAAPTGLTAAAGNAQVGLSWNASSGATSYNVYRGTTVGGEGATPIATGITSTSYTNTGLTNGTTYYYKIAAVNANGTSAQSTEASATPTAGTNLVANGTYTIVGIQSGKALDDPGWSTATGVQMDIWTVNTGNNQKWVLTNLGNNVVKLVNAFSGLALEVKDGSTSNGAVVDQAAYTALTKQQWTLVKVSSGIYNLKNVNSGHLLDVIGAKTADGTLVDQWPSNNGTNQQWKFQ